VSERISTDLTISMNVGYLLAPYRTETLTVTNTGGCTMKKISVALFALAAALVISPIALALPVSGSVSIAGTDTWSTTSISFVPGSSNVTSDLGTFSVIPTSSEWPNERRPGSDEPG